MLTFETNQHYGQCILGYVLFGQYFSQMSVELPPRVTGLVKDAEGKTCGAKMRDEITGEEWTTRAKCVINATGPFVDSIRKMDDQGRMIVMELCQLVNIWNFDSLCP